MAGARRAVENVLRFSKRTTYDDIQDRVNANPSIITSAQKCALYLQGHIENLDVRVGGGYHLKEASRVNDILNVRKSVRPHELTPPIEGITGMLVELRLPETFTSCLSSVIFRIDRGGTSVPQGYGDGTEPVNPICMAVLRRVRHLSYSRPCCT